MIRTVLALMVVVALTSPARAQSETEIDADRPHVGTGMHVVPFGEVQFELGGQALRFATRTASASPVLMRVGLGGRVEGRFATDGLLVDSMDGANDVNLANAQASAKIRLFGDVDESWLSVLPAFTFVANDPSVTLLAGAALTARAHVEANYGIGSISNGGERFAQHLVTGAVTHATTRTLTTYAEAAWWSRQDARGGAVSFIDSGVIFAATPRVLVDAGALVGLTDDTADYGIFTGVSFLLGTPRGAPRTARAATSVFRGDLSQD